MTQIETRRCLGGGWRRWIAFTVADDGRVIAAAFGLTETHARRRFMAALDASLAAGVLA